MSRRPHEEDEDEDNEDGDEDEDEDEDNEDEDEGEEEGEAPTPTREDLIQEVGGIIKEKSKTFFIVYRDLARQRRPIVLTGPVSEQLALLAPCVTALLDHYEDASAPDHEQFAKRVRTLLRRL